MNKILATLVALTLAFTLNSAAQAHGGHGGHGHVGHGHYGHYGHGHFGHYGHYHLRHFGQYSHRHWDGRYNRWMYFHPGYHRWYYQAGANWAQVPMNESPAIPGENDPDE
jgi:hypothetical protein